MPPQINEVAFFPILVSMETKQNNKLKEVIDRLEIESWQLELLVSGFAIFLVAASFDPILEFGRRVNVVYEGMSTQFDILMIIPSGLLASIFFVFVNLLLHLVFRGLWISAIGIRFLSGDIDLESLRLAKPFDRFLGKRLQSFDRFIEKLERISSVIFGFTFLLVFMIMSMILLVLFVQLMFFVFQWVRPYFSEETSETIFGLGTFFFVLGALFYFIDFISIGFFKSRRWISVWYYPLYRFFSWITLAAVYRPLYYNLIDNQFGRRVVLALVPYMFLMLSIVSIRSDIYQYIPEDDQSRQLILELYDNERGETTRIKTASLPSRYVDNGYLELFIHSVPKVDNETITKKYPKLRAPKEEGIKWLFYQRKVREKDRSPADSLLQAMASLYQIRIDDSLYQDLDYFFFETEKYKQQGLKTIIDIAHLDRGKHQVSIDKWMYTSNERDSITVKNFVKIPFWKE